MKKINLLILACFMSLTNFATNITYYWVGGTSGNWTTAANWSLTSGGAGGTGAAYPQANDAVIFDNGLTTGVTYDIAGSIGYKSFTIINNTQLTLSNSVASNRTFGINSTGGIYYTVVETGSSLTLKSNANNSFTFSATSGYCVFNGPVNCVNQAINTANGPKLDASSDSIIINDQFYVGPQITQTGSNSSGSRWRFGANSVYQIDKNGGVTLAGKYSPTALIKVTGTTTNPPTFGAGFGNAYGSIEINVPGASQTLNLGFGSSNSVQGYFKITNSNNQIIRLATNPPNPLNIGGDVVVNNGTLQVSNSGTAITLNIGGKLQVDPGTTFDLQGSSGANTINVNGDLVAPGTLTVSGSATAAKLALTSTTAQQALTFGTISSAFNLQLNNTSGNVFILNSDLIMPNNANAKLTLTSGVVNNAGGNTVYLQNGATTALAGGAVASYINGGKFKRDIANGASAGVTYFFPIGKGNNYRPVKLFPSANTTALNTFSVESFNAPYSTTTPTNPSYSISGFEYWDISRIAGAADAFDVSIITDNTTNSGFTLANIANVEVGHFNGTTWDNLGNNSGNVVYNATGAEINTTGVTNFSPFTFTAPISILPIAIEYLHGVKSGTANVLDWKVSCSGTASLGMTIERSTNGRDFSPINTISATSVMCLQPFSFTDNKPVNGYNYYRLKTTEDNGKSTYSTTLLIINANKGFDIVNLIPSVVKSNFIVNISSSQNSKVNIVITDAAGKQVYKNSGYSLIAGSNQVPLNIANLAAGYYWLTAYAEDGNIKTTSFVKQ